MIKSLPYFHKSTDYSCTDILWLKKDKRDTPYVYQTGNSMRLRYKYSLNIQTGLQSWILVPGSTNISSCCNKVCWWASRAGALISVLHVGYMRGGALCGHSLEVWLRRPEKPSIIAHTAVTPTLETSLLLHHLLSPNCHVWCLYSTHLKWTWMSVYFLYPAVILWGSGRKQMLVNWNSNSFPLLKTIYNSFLCKESARNGEKIHTLGWRWRVVPY